MLDLVNGAKDPVFNFARSSFQSNAALNLVRSKRSKREAGERQVMEKID